MNVLGIHTRCRTIDELIAWLHPVSDEISIFIATSKLVATGTESPFAILLADRQIAVQGWCVVFDTWSDAQSPYGRPGIRLGLHRLTPESKLVIDRVQAARVARSPVIAPAAPRVASEVRRPLTIKTPSLRPDESRAVKRIASCAIPRVVFDAPTARVADPLAAMRAASSDREPTIVSAPRAADLARAADPLAAPAPLLAEGSRPTADTRADTDTGYVIDVPSREIAQRPPSTPTRYWIPVMCASTIASLVAWVTLVALGRL